MSADILASPRLFDLPNGIGRHIDRSECTSGQQRLKSAAIAIAEPLSDPHAERKKDSYYLPEIPLVDRYVDEPRSLRVAVVGAGLSGIMAGVLLPAKVPGINLTIFDKNEDVGGTWFENIYPGVRCDVPAHVYQTSFEPNTQWSEEYAQGPEIREYWTKIARKYEVYKYLKLAQRVEELTWDNERSIWSIRIRDLHKDAVYVHEADFVLTAHGRFNAWRLPSYHGMSEYKGLLRHVSNWDPTFDLPGKRIAIIGNGASGIQLLSNVHGKVAHIDHYARNKTWIAPNFFHEDATTVKPVIIPDHVRESYKNDDTYLDFRKSLENNFWRFFPGWLKGHDANKKAREETINHLKQRLAKRPELIEDMIPEFPPHCRRFTPGAGYFEAITSDDVEYIRTHIKRFTETGIETVDGKHREVDAVFCATGANVDCIPPYKITAHGKNISDLWSEDGEFGFPYNYLGIATPGFPNLLFVQGPNPAGRSGTIPHNIEVQLTLFARILRKVGREGIKTMQPSKKATADFVQYSDAFWKTTVMSDCSSWYNNGKPGSRIHGLWPGSAALVTIISQDPRWEDWDYEYLLEGENRLAYYFGLGSTKLEADPNSDMTTYLKKPGEIDLKKLHEGWWSVP